VYVCIGEYVHFLLLIPKCEWYQQWLKAEIYYMYVIGIYYVWNSCVIEAKYMLYISQSRIASCDCTEQKDEELNKNWKTKAEESKLGT
jgi:hypothetical protein